MVTGMGGHAARSGYQSTAFTDRSAMNVIAILLAISPLSTSIGRLVERKKGEMLWAHLKCIPKLDRLRFKGPNGATARLLVAVIV